MSFEDWFDEVKKILVDEMEFTQEEITELVLDNWEHYYLLDLTPQQAVWSEAQYWGD